MSVDPDEMRDAVRWLAGRTVAKADQVQAMSDRELGSLLLAGGWTTIEVHEAGRRLIRSASDKETDG